MKKLYAVEVRGKTTEWSFSFWGDPEFVKDWEEDGLTINEIVNTIPDWIVAIGLIGPWCFFQDIFNLKNPFK